MKIIVRSASTGDESFILNAWLKSQRYTSRYWGSVEQNAYFEYMPSVIQARLKHGAYVAVLQDTPLVILGFSCQTAEALHYVYVKKEYRGKGIAKLLVGDNVPKIYTSQTVVGQAIAGIRGMKFNPFL